MRRFTLFLLLIACNQAPSASTPTLLADYDLGGGKLALLMKGSPRTRFGRDIDATPTLGDFKLRWALVVKDRATKTIVAETLLADLPGDTLVKPWFRRSGNRLWVWDTHQLLFFDLENAKLLYTQAQLPQVQPVFTPPFQLHDRVSDPQGWIVIRDRKGFFWKIDPELKAKPTNEGKIEDDWRNIEVAEREGCNSKIWWEVGGGNDRKGVYNMTKPKMYGKAEPDETYLQPQLFVDKTRHCLLDGPKGPLLFTPDNLSKGAPMMLVYADGKTSKAIWNESLTLGCGVQGMPSFASTTSERVTFVFPNGGVCQLTLKDGKPAWKKTLQEIAPGATRLSSVRKDGDALTLWISFGGTKLERVSVGSDGEVIDRIEF